MAGYRSNLLIIRERALAHNNMPFWCAKTKNALFCAPFYTENDRFTKTGSGQTQDKLRKERAFF